LVAMMALTTILAGFQQTPALHLLTMEEAELRYLVVVVVWPEW
jgi:hypothetical protein